MNPFKSLLGSRFETWASALVAFALLWLSRSPALGACAQFQWLLLSPPTSPPAAWPNQRLAYDSSRHLSVLFGNLEVADTWEFNGTNWTQRSPPVYPPVHGSHGMSYDPVRRVTLVFDGLTRVPIPGGSKAIPVNDLWEWDGINWTQVPVAGTWPGVRYDHGMVYDSSRGVHVVFGGEKDQLLGPFTNETWEYNAVTRTWTLRTTNGPSPRAECGMVYDSARRQTVMYGGWGDTGELNDTWTYDGVTGTWTQQGGSAPSPRSHFSMAYDRDRAVTLMLGGFEGNAWLGDQWEWDGSNWTLSNRFFCCPRDYAAMVYEDDRHEMLLFGGHGYADNGTFVLSVNFGPPGNPIAYIDWTNTGTQDGSLAHPFTNIHQALDWFYYGAGTEFSINTGNYNEGRLRLCLPGRLLATGGRVQIR